MNNSRDEEILKTFGKNLKSIRTIKKFSLRKLADEADIDFSQIHRIEKGETNPGLTIIIALIKAMDIEISELIDESIYRKKDKLI